MNTNPAQVLTFEMHGTTLRLLLPSLNLLTLEVEGETWFSGGEIGHPLWEVLAVDEGGRQVKLHGDAGTASAEMLAGVLVLTWQGVADAATGAGPFDVRVEVRPTGKAPGITGWRIAVNNRSAWTLWSVTFPQLPHLTPSDDAEADRLFFPQGWGTELVGWSKMIDLHRAYPRGWDFAMQLVGYTRGARTFSLATHDPALTTKRFVFTHREKLATRWADFAVISYPEGMSTAGNSLLQEYDTIVAVQPGDWYDAARLYAGWARHQSWACCPQVPRAADDVQGWQVLQVPDKPMDTWAADMERLAEHVGVRLGIQYYNWHVVPFDTSYPDYFPPREGFKGLATRTQRAGYLTMPYINGRLWDINAPSWPARGAERYAAKGSSLRLNPLTLFNYREEYGSGQQLSPMCPTTAFWQDTVIDLCTRIVNELGCDGVYIDQIAAEGAMLCFDRTHEHPIGGGSFWLEGYREMLRRIREAVPSAYLTTECNWEGCTADYDGLLMWHSLGSGLIPLFPAVYAGLAKTYGCQFHAGDLAENDGAEFASRMAMLFVWGAQLGWGDLTLLLDPQYALLLDYFTVLCRERALQQATFTAGRMLRPPAVTLTRQLDTSEASTGAFDAALAPLTVFASVWQHPSGDGATVFLVNPMRDQVQVDVRITAVECANMTVGEPLQGEISMRGTSGNPPAFSAVLPPLGVLVVPLG